jgi:ribose transport system substrate-binding protein
MRAITIRTFLATLIICAAPSLFAAPKIGVLLKAKQGGGGFWQSMEKGAVEAGERLGAEVTVNGPLQETDIGVQVKLLNAMAARGVDAIVIAPINKEALAVPIASIAVRGVKIVTIDTPLTGSAAPVFIGTDQEAAGKAAGELLGKLINDTDEVSIFRHSQASGATQVRETGAIAALRAARPKAEVHGEIYASSEPGAEKAKAELVLQQHPNIKAVLATGTPGSLAMLEVLKEKKLAGTIKLVGCGFNLTPDIASAIESGALSGWIAQLPKEMGAKGVEAAVSLVKGEKVPAVVHTDFLVITKDNLQDPKVQALLKL